MKKSLGSRLDNAGAVASWLCAVHCLIVPFFVTLLPLAGLSFLVEETTERVFIIVSSLIAVFSLMPAYLRLHRRLYPLTMAAGGLGMIIVTHLLFEDIWLVKLVLLICGALLLTLAHFLNRRLCHSCEAC